MIRVDCSAVSPVCRKYGCWILALCWLLGLICGSLLFLHAGPSFLTLMRRIIFIPVSISGLLSNLLIPFLITVYSVYFSMLWLIFFVCFLEGAALSWSAAGILVAFSSAGWLIHWLVLLRSSFLAASAFPVWVRIFSGGKTGAVFCWWFFAATALCILDYTVISPFLASLIIH